MISKKLLVKEKDFEKEMAGNTEELESLVQIAFVEESMYYEYSDQILQIFSNNPK